MKYFSLLLFSVASLGANYNVGQRDFSFEDKARGRKLSTYVWYPVDKATKMEANTGFSVFAPVVSALNAPVLKSQTPFPVILLSHGSGGKADKLFWFTDTLVQNGYIVLGVDHPGNKTGDNSALGMMKVWERAKDLSLALDRISETPEFKTRLDLNRVSAVGHSAGGATVLLLAGGLLSSEKLANPMPNCSYAKDPYVIEICNQAKAIDMKSFPKAVVEASYQDPRVKSVIAFDPGFVRSFKPESLKNLKTKAFVYVADLTGGPAGEFYTRDFLTLMPGRSKLVPGSYHMTFLQPCKADYPKDDEELKGLCVENDRKISIQDTVVKESLAFLK